MTKTLHGKVHGRTIELDEDLGVAEGQEVEVHVRMIGPKKRLPGPPPGWRPGVAAGSPRVARCTAQNADLPGFPTPALPQSAPAGRRSDPECGRSGLAASAA